MPRRNGAPTLLPKARSSKSSWGAMPKVQPFKMPKAQSFKMPKATLLPKAVASPRPFIAPLPKAPRQPSFWRRLFGGRDWSDRPPIPSSVRRAVLKRGGYHCARCGATTDLQIDHIYPYSRGGSSDQYNLQVLCGRCNRAKGARI